MNIHLFFIIYNGIHPKWIASPSQDTMHTIPYWEHIISPY